MVRTSQSAKPAARISAQVGRTLREGALWVFGSLSLILWVALFSYDPADPGFTQASGSGEVHNSIGTAGALVADLLFNFFGRPAYLFTVMVFYLGWMIYREQKTQQALTKADYALRVGGFIATLITSCALASLHFSPDGFRETAGGIVGPARGWRHGVADEIARCEHALVIPLDRVHFCFPRNFLVQRHGSNWTLVSCRLGIGARETGRVARQSGRPAQACRPPGSV
jgi:hypothetical protein